MVATKTGRKNERLPLFAVVDIETTGGSPRSSAITEIAIIQHDGEKETGRFESLINPMQAIPPAISRLTGITNDMVASAPTFAEVALAIEEFTENRVFVAHNVQFDYRFVQHQFSIINQRWQRKQLCTVRLSRKAMPGLKSYSLGRIATHLGHHIEHRHRAMGDCEFTAQLLATIVNQGGMAIISEMLKGRSNEAGLPPFVSEKLLCEIPEKMGVYRFLDPQGKVIYIGKANNLKQRVTDHVKGHTHSSFKNRFAEQIQDIKWEVCPNEFHTLLTEAAAIKKHWPPFNNSLKRVSLNWGIYSYTDQRGVQRFTIGRVGKWNHPLSSFQHRAAAEVKMRNVARQFHLCAKYCDLGTEPCMTEYADWCGGACNGASELDNYNEQAAKAATFIANGLGNAALVSEGFTAEERSVVLLEKGRYKAHGCVSVEALSGSYNDLKNHFQAGYDDQDIQAIIDQFATAPTVTAIKW